MQKAHAFVLYVDAASAVSWRAARTLLDALERRPSSWWLEIRDLGDPTVLEESDEETFFHPTLVRLEPTPECWLIGDLAREGMDFIFEDA